MSVYLDLNEDSPYGRVIDTTPVVDSRLWRGVVIGLLIEVVAAVLCILFIVACGYLGYLGYLARQS